MKKKSYLTVLAFMVQYFSEPEPEEELIMENKEDNEIIRVFTDSEGDIQVCLEEWTENGEDGDELDGGGIMVMTSEEDEEDRIKFILYSGTPEKISELVTEKALFIWELIHTA